MACLWKSHVGSAGCGSLEGGLQSGGTVGGPGGGGNTCLGSASQPCVPACVEGDRVFPPPQGPVPLPCVLLVTCLCSFLQLVSDTRRVSDIQWFREAYGALTQTVRVVALEQSRQQRGWVFTAGELCTAFVPGHPLPRSPSALFLAGCGGLSEGV